MAFIKQTIDETMDVWEKCYKSQFVQELAKGTLPLEKFKFYIIQDSIYLKQYARVYAMAMYRSTTLKDIQVFYNILSFVSDSESAVRLNYLKKFDITDDDIEFMSATETNKNYTDYMLQVAETSEIPEILMAVLPCMIGYCYVFTEIVKNYADIKKSPYWELIEDYANDEYIQSCEFWAHYADSKCERLPAERKEKLKQIFRQASLHELYFWEMVFGQANV